MVPPLSVLLPVVLACAGPDPASSDSLEALYQHGQTFAGFLEGVRARRATWTANYGAGRIDAALLARARALPDGFRLLVVTVDGCSDSANTIPFLASLVDSMAGKVEVRLVSPGAGRWVMERHRTWDRRAATPTVILLDREGNEAGCWVERPAELGAWSRTAQLRLSQAEFLRQKTEWYDHDAGRETLRELVAMMEQAGPGRPCGGNAGG
jgi:hypothetical protein